MKKFLVASICIKEKVEEGREWVSVYLNGFPDIYELKKEENGRGGREVSRRKGKKKKFSCRERN